VKASCTSAKLPDVCALQELVAQAKAKKASYIVLPEYAVEQEYYEPTPMVGENPATSSAWPGDMIIKMFSLQAKKLGVYVVLNLLTWEGTQANPTKYNTSLAFDPTGKVVGVHRKFNLFGKESQTLTAGKNVSVFQTPLGKIGLLICADIYGSSTLNQKLAYTLKADVVAVSSYWTVSNPINTWYKNYLGKYPYYSIVANTTHSPGYGGGVFKTPWQALDVKIGTSPSIAVATIP
jgi:predicted amidohydrolase